ncbi:hypothetical protein GCM10007162_13230 [Ignatzschineria ureiclastica]|nr:hypothetical protein GCM10007162_13230 [Ignatzschineria ureiclastica]
MPVGKYVGNNGSSALTITEKRHRQYFEVDILGANGHSCYADGYIKDADMIQNNEQIGVVIDEDTPDQCLLSFKMQGNQLRLDVLSEQYSEACQQYCGARAFLFGEFKIPPAYCTHSNIQQARNRFKQFYDQKRYADAENILNKVLTQCDFYLDFILKDSIRSDLALTLYHQQQPELCLEVLTPTIALNEEVYLPPTDAENYRKTEKGILFNYNLCQKAIR